MALSTNHTPRVVLWGSLMLLGANPIVLAQEASQSVDGASDATPEERREGPTTLEEIIVTASKRSELLSTVPASVSALSGEKLEGIGAASFQDFATYMPGVSSASRGTGENQVVVRGVTTGTQTSSTVGVYVDELPVGSSSAFAFGVYGLDFNLFDLQRVELLSGPQGTLYGASSLGGLLKYVTASPSTDALAATIQGEGSRTEAAESSNYSGRAMLNVPFRIRGLDVPLAIRATGFSENLAGFVDNPSLRAEDVDSSKTLGGRASILAELTRDLDVRFGVAQQKISREGASTVDYDPHTHRPVNGRYDQSTKFEEPFLSKFLQYSGVANWKSDWGDLTSASGWQDTDLAITFDQTPALGGFFGTGDAVPYEVDVGAALQKFTQEVRFASQKLRLLDWRIGGFYTSERAHSLARLSTPASDPLPVEVPPILDAGLSTKYRELAVFGDATWHVTDRADLTVGSRYAGNDQEFRQLNRGLLGTIPSDDSLKKSSEKVVTYLVNPRYNLSESLMVYGRFASGYRPGGPNFIVPPPLPPAPPTYSADTVWNYELGLKRDFSSRASIDLDAFYIDWSNIQLLVNSNSLNTIQNGGKAKVIGGEIVASYLVRSGLIVGGNMSYSRATLTEDVPGLQAKDGQPLPLSPRASAALTTDYEFPLWDCCRTSAGMSYRFVGRRPSGFDGSNVHPQYWLERYSMFDLRTRFQWKDLDLSLFLKNVFNEQGGISADASALQYNADAPVRVTVTQPRTVGLTLTYRM